MKKIIICLMAALMGFSAMAQERRVEIYKGGEVVFSESVANVDSITVNYYYPYVDLGLPSGVKWSTMNIGQTDAFRAVGDYFAWGEIATKEIYLRDNSLTVNNKELTEISGNPQYDAARAIWGGAWRMPTQAEVEELMAECTWELNRFNITGRGEIVFYTVTGPNGKSIDILVSGGYYSGETLTNQEYGYFWISTSQINSANARYLRVKTDGTKELVWTGRFIGVPIRPVMD